MDCPICHQHVAENANITTIGNSDIHSDCLNQLRKEAESKSATLHFIWRGDYCMEVRLAFEDHVMQRTH